MEDLDPHVIHPSHELNNILIGSAVFVGLSCDVAPEDVKIVQTVKTAYMSFWYIELHSKLTVTCNVLDLSTALLFLYCLCSCSRSFSLQHLQLLKASFKLLITVMFQALDADVREHMTEQTNKITYTRVDEVCRKLWIRGTHLDLISKFLISKGM